MVKTQGRFIFMRLTHVFCLLAVSAGLASAQGVLNFATAAGGAGGTVNAPATNYFIPCCAGGYDPSIDGQRASGPMNMAQLYIGPAGTTDASLLTTNGVSGGPEVFRTGAQAGYVIGGTRTISGYAPGTTITVQVRAWFAVNGETSWGQASFRNRTSISGPSAPNLVQVVLGDPSGTVPNLVGSTGFIIPFFVPEPGTWALLALGSATLMLRIRRRN